jgi:hypothetical protein
MSFTISLVAVVAFAAFNAGSALGRLLVQTREDQPMTSGGDPVSAVLRRHRRAIR